MRGGCAVIRQPASPHWQAWGLGGSNLGRSFGERRIASFHREVGAGRGLVRGVRGEGGRGAEQPAGGCAEMCGWCAEQPWHRRMGEHALLWYVHH